MRAAKAGAGWRDLFRSASSRKKSRLTRAEAALDSVPSGSQGEPPGASRVGSRPRRRPDPRRAAHGRRWRRVSRSRCAGDVSAQERPAQRGALSAVNPRAAQRTPSARFASRPARACLGQARPRRSSPGRNHVLRPRAKPCFGFGWPAGVVLRATWHRGRDRVPGCARRHWPADPRWKGANERAQAVEFFPFGAAGFFTQFDFDGNAYFHRAAVVQEECAVWDVLAGGGGVLGFDFGLGRCGGVVVVARAHESKHSYQRELVVSQGRAGRPGGARISTAEKSRSSWPTKGGGGSGCGQPGAHPLANDGCAMQRTCLNEAG